jgi:cell wall-associated NlpC family hydrolase
MTAADLNDLFFAHYVAGGRGPQAFDCFGLFREVCRRRGVLVPEHPTPMDLADREFAIVSVAATWRRLAAPQPWCAAVFRIGPFVSHLGVVLDDGLRFIHASRGSGIAIEPLASPRWAQRIAGYYVHD